MNRNKELNNFGTLYVVATPIGNLQDMSLRALEVLKTVNCVAAEDTRHSTSLLRHFAINTPIISLHEHNEREKVAYLLERLQKGESIALVSDAGTPLISDPGYFLVRETKEAGVKVVPVPGACAAIAALSASGLPTDKFVFEGFLPVKNKARNDRLTELCDESRTIIFYEAPHRILEVLQAMSEVFGPERKAVLARELTKTFETIESRSLGELCEWVASDTNQQRGEIVLMVAGGEEKPQSNYSVQQVLEVLLTELPLKQAVDLAVKITGEKKNAVYELALKLKK